MLYIVFKTGLRLGNDFHIVKSIYFSDIISNLRLKTNRQVVCPKIKHYCLFMQLNDTLTLYFL